jgi:hypothetical protein
MSDSRPRRLRNVSITTVIALVLTTAVSTVVIAAHTFPVDVPDDNTFHDDIAWLASNDVTRGCNPPDNDAFCPDDPVTREQMSAFMHRFAGTFGTVGDQVTDTSSPVTVDSTDLVELAAVTVRPEADANVTLDGHFSVGVPEGDLARVHAIIARDSCEGDVVGSASWRANDVTGLETVGSVSITGFDQIADATDGQEITDYVLCASKVDDNDLEGTVHHRGLTATWVPSE